MSVNYREDVVYDGKQLPSGFFAFNASVTAVIDITATFLSSLCKTTKHSAKRMASILTYLFVKESEILDVNS